MRAAVEDRLRVRGEHVGEPDRVGMIHALGVEGAPPYRARFEETERTVYPGPDAVIENAGMSAAAETAEEFTEDLGQEFASDAQRIAHGIEEAGEKIGEAFRR
jgi:hypothetical protein